MQSALIAVDRWVSGSQAYFLTHLHSDHTAGLSASWSFGPVFCSRLTAKLFPFKFPGFPLSLLRVVDVGRWHSLSLVSPSSGLSAAFQVMPIDAHHCPGAVMYLFRGEFGCMLYTGDFRWEENDPRAKISRVMLLDALDGHMVETLYMDNTYCNPSFSFPSREIASQQVVDIIISHPEHDIIIGIDTLGKEELLLYISRALKIKIWVWPERLRTLHLLGFGNIFTTKTSLTRVRAVSRYSFRIDTLEGLNMIRPTIGIMPSGLPWAVKPNEGNKCFGSLATSSNNAAKCYANNDIHDETNAPNGNVRSVERFHKYIYTVPYSDHSCFNEIQDFFKLVCPANIKGIVCSSFCYIDPSYHLGHLCKPKQWSQGLYMKHGSTVEGRQMDPSGIESSSANGISFDKGRKRAGAVGSNNFSGIRMSRVSLLRQRQRGLKIGDK